MTGLLEQLSGDAKNRKRRAEMHLQFLRLRRFLDNVRDIITRVEDARDKLQQEYIFDRHYVLFLIDGILEGLSMAAFNASVLVPSSGNEIYRKLDDLKKFAREAFLQPSSIYKNDFELSPIFRDADPETRLLASILNWYTGPMPETRPVLQDFIRFVVDEVFCSESIDFEKKSAGAGEVELGDGNTLKLVDIDGISDSCKKRHVRAGSIICRPFGLLFLGFMDAGRDRTPQSGGSDVARWMLYSEEAVSLRLNGSNFSVHLEATLFGDIASDSIFLYFQNPFDPGSALFSEFQAITTKRGTFAWIFDIPTDYLERQLIRLGPELLG
jgi:hypothetical protein